VGNAEGFFRPIVEVIAERRPDLNFSSMAAISSP